MNRVKQLGRDYEMQREEDLMKLRKRVEYAKAHGGREQDPEDEFIRVLIFPTRGSADLSMVKANKDAVEKMVMNSCPGKYRDRAEVKVIYPKGGGLAAFFAVPTRESGLAKDFRWRASYGSGFDEYLLSPAFMVAINRGTGQLRDFSIREYRRALGFDRDDYRREKMLGLEPGERIALVKGEIPLLDETTRKLLAKRKEPEEIVQTDKTDRIVVLHENWQILTVSIEHGGRKVSVAIPKSNIFDRELEFLRYETGEVIK